MNALPLFQPPVLSSRTARVVNALLPFADDGFSFPWLDTNAVLRLVPLPSAFSPDIRLVVRWFGGIWTLELGGIDVARIHPLLKELPPEAALPEALRLAALDMLAFPALAALSTLGGTPQPVENTFLKPGSIPEPSEPFLWLELVLPDGSCFPARVRLPEEDAPVQALLAAFPPKKSFAVTPATGMKPVPDLTTLPIAVVVEAGSMCLNTTQCRELSIGDILLPDDYPARENRIRLRFHARGTLPVLLCSVCGLAATIELMTLTPEPSMTDPAPQNVLESIPENAEALPDAAPVSPEVSVDAISRVPVPDLDLSVSFELEHRLMTVAEVAELRLGHTFTLTTDPLSPVTLRVQGKPVGTGRLVDLGGALGVQITSLA